MAASPATASGVSLSSVSNATPMDISPQRPLKASKHHMWTSPLKVRVCFDSIGRLTSKNYYTSDAQTQVASECNIVMQRNVFTGGDLPEVVGHLENDANPRDLDLIILMSNNAANTLGQELSSGMEEACRRLHRIAESAPAYVIYGGPGEMWPLVTGREGGLACFESKTARIREILASSPNIKAISGAKDFCAFFAESDLDYMGHIKGVARHKAIEWLVKILKDVSDDHFKCRFMQPNVQCGRVAVEDPLATKFALAKIPPVPRLELPPYWQLRTLSDASPNVFLLSGPDDRCKPQQYAAKRMFEELGWQPRLVFGISHDRELPHPRSHWAWACALLPKLMHIVETSNCTEDEVVLLGEDSCWPTDSCTPQEVRTWMQDAIQHGYQGMWIGACGGMKKRRFDMKVNSHGCREAQACEVKRAPCGSKLFAVTIRQLRLMRQVWGWVPQNWFVDGVNQLLAASGMLMIRDEFLAGSMQHFSLRLGKFVDVGLNITLRGTPLAEGRLVGDSVQKDSPYSP